MKISKKQLFVSIASIVVVLISLAVLLCDYLIPIRFWTHPMLNFLFSLFLGFGIIAFILGLTNKSPWYFFLCSFCVGLSLIYAMLQYLPWWIGLVVVGCAWFVLVMISLITSGNKTEAIALNKQSDYKDYNQRKAENFTEEQNKPQEELPEIKTFKD